MSVANDLKTIFGKIRYPDKAKVIQQVEQQISQVKNRLSHIRHKVLVMSGKGGVGKSMVTANLSLAFARQGLRTGVLDVDLNGPCIPKMLGLRGERFRITPEGALPPEGPLGIKVASMEFFLKQGNPVRWKGPTDLSPVWLGVMEMSVIREFLADVSWGEMDLMLVDLPPGAAADKPPAIAEFMPDLDGAVVVTTPSDVALEVVRKSVLYARDVGIRFLGLVVNMGGMVCPECHAESEMFEGESKTLSEELKIPLLETIPFDRRISRACDHGIPLMEESDGVVRRFADVAKKISDQILQGRVS